MDKIVSYGGISFFSFSLLLSFAFLSKGGEGRKRRQEREGKYKKGTLAALPSGYAL